MWNLELCECYGFNGTGTLKAYPPMIFHCVTNVVSDTLEAFAAPKYLFFLRGRKISDKQRQGVVVCHGVRNYDEGNFTSESFGRLSSYANPWDVIGSAVSNGEQCESTETRRKKEESENACVWARTRGRASAELEKKSKGILLCDLWMNARTAERSRCVRGS